MEIMEKGIKASIYIILIIFFILIIIIMVKNISKEVQTNLWYKTEYELSCINEYGHNISNQISIITVSDSESPCSLSETRRMNLTNYGTNFSYKVTCKVINCNTIKTGGK